MQVYTVVESIMSIYNVSSVDTKVFADKAEAIKYLDTIKTNWLEKVKNVKLKFSKYEEITTDQLIKSHYANDDGEEHIFILTEHKL